MVAETIFIIAEQLSDEEQVRLYKMLGEKLKPKTTKRKSKSKFDITDEESIAMLKKMYFCRKVREH